MNFVPRSGLKPVEMTPNMIEAMYMQWRNNNVLYLPLLSGLLSIEEWRTRELEKLNAR